MKARDKILFEIFENEESKNLFAKVPQDELKVIKGIIGEKLPDVILGMRAFSEHVKNNSTIRNALIEVIKNKIGVLNNEVASPVKTLEQVEN
jgi:hypothetical protein